MPDPRQTGTSRIDPENPNHELSERDARESQGLEPGKTAGKAEGEDESRRSDRSRTTPGKTPGSAEGEDD